MSKTIVITGGAGFLGSHLCDAFLARDYKVIALDNLSTGAEANIAHLSDNSRFTFVEHDICEPLPKAVTGIAEIHVVANLASPASPPHYQRLALETLDVNSVGTRNMLELARSAGARFFHTSTSEVYGDPTIHPQPEEYWGNVNSYGPRAMYDEGKRFAEALVYSYREKHGLNTGIVRIFNTYGPRMDPDDGRVVSNLIMQALRGESMTIYGDGSQTRSFCYVDDLIAGFVTMIESDEEGPINMGNPREFTILELVELVRELTGTKSELVTMPLPGDDPTRRKPKIERATRVLGWEPEVQLREGLKKTIAYFETVVAAQGVDQKR